jgi:hypothetical protein
VHDLIAGRIWGIACELATSGLVVLGDEAPSARFASACPIRDGTSPPPRRTPTTLMPGCAPGERANTKLKSWRILRKLAVAPGALGSGQGNPRPSGPRNRNMNAQFFFEPLAGFGLMPDRAFNYF